MSADPLIGKQLGDYTIVDILGRGGMARVYRGYDANLDRYAAVKVINTNPTAIDDHEYRERFQREARAIARLRHDRIVSVYQFGQTDNTYYMAMVFINGRDLRQVLKSYAEQGRRMSHEEVMRVIRDIGGALDYAHKEGVIHRDIKPSNIMITEDGSAVLTDFGLALSVPEGTTGNTFGSAHYIAPEQAISSARAVPQSDLYSLGVVLYEMLAGQVPFDDPSAMSVALKHLNDLPPPPSRFNPSLSSFVEEVVLRTMDKEPSKRFANCAELIGTLEHAFANQAPEAPTARPKLAIPDEKTAPLVNFDSKPSATRSSSMVSTPAPVQPTAAANGGSMAKKPTAAARNKLRSAMPVIIGGAVILLLVASAAILSGGLGGNAQPPEALVIAQVTEEPTVEVIVTEVTKEPTVTGIELTEAIATVTDAPTETRLPANVPTSTVEVTVEASAVSAADITDEPDRNNPLLLTYTPDTVILINRSERSIDVRGLTFIQTRDDGNRTFDSNSWFNVNFNGGLGSGDCVQLWTDNIASLPIPENCESRYAWRQVTQIRWFWISEDPDTTFEVRRGDDVLAVCTVGAGECAFPVE